MAMFWCTLKGSILSITKIATSAGAQFLMRPLDEYLYRVNKI